jgi:hypothetical protein
MVEFAKTTSASECDAPNETAEPQTESPPTEPGEPGPEEQKRGTENPSLCSARDYVRRGMHAVPIRRDTKKPVEGWEWKKRKLKEADLDKYYGNPLTACNIGIVLGGEHGQTDVDLDWPFANAFGDVLLSDLIMFGRRSKPRSHRLAICHGITSKKFVLPASLKGHSLLPKEHSLCVAEIRSTNSYTVFPYGVHETGETIEFDGASPTGIPILDPGDLQARVGLVAFCAATAQMFPPKGMRNDFCLALQGTLLRCPYIAKREDRIELVRTLVKRIAELGGSSDPNGRSSSVSNTAAKIESGTDCTGLPRVVELLGLPKECKAVFRNWLGASEEEADDEHLVEMNSRHCVIEDIGGKCLVLNEVIDPVTGEATVTFSTFAALVNLYANRSKIVGYKPDGEPIRRPLSEWWYHHQFRRQMKHVAFTPGRNVERVYNLWRGFSVAPDGENSVRRCRRFLKHIHENICSGDPKLFRYVIEWMARGVQFPGQPGEVALVLRGKMGIGKGTFARHYGALFGKSFIPVTKPDHVIGRFNGHMGECILLFADECFFAGNPQHEQILKVLVTERRWLIERKGIDAFPSESCLHIILACNEEWSVPVDQDDRRYCCIEVGAAHMRDRDYFQALDDEMRNGGREALLGFLLKVNLSSYNPESFPRTAEHVRQQANTRKGVTALVEEWCHEGRLPCADIDHPDVAITSGAEFGRGFDFYVKKQAPTDVQRLGTLKVKNKLKEWKAEHWRESSGLRRAGIQFPPLQDLRRKFEEQFGPQQWRAPNVTEWETAGGAAYNMDQGPPDNLPF